MSPAHTPMYWCPCCFAGLAEIETAEKLSDDIETEQRTCDECRDCSQPIDTESA